MSDVINRQDAIDGLMPIYKSAYSRNRNVFSVAKQCMKVLEELPSAQPDQKWIPCSERLPDKADHIDDMVLVCYGNGSVRFNTCMNGEWVQGNPVAWMPLPKPWKGEDNG